MGLLDEAIREHLELQRRRGADPGEIARAESAALTPVLEREHAEAPAEPEPEPGAPEPELGPAEPSATEPEPGDFPPSPQETVEIDMRGVLDEQHPHEGPPEQVPGQERLSFE
jgi:hypothetical protein